MKRIFLILSLTIFALGWSQQIALNKVVKVNDNKDKFLYKIDNPKDSEYLAEIVVNGFSNDDTAVFGQVYKKAKEVGANTFSIKLLEQVDGSQEKLDPAHYYINLYYTNPEVIPVEYNTIYVLSSSNKDQKLAVNNVKFNLKERHFVKKTFVPTETVSVSTRKLLGSGIKVTGKEDHPVQYFQVTNFKVMDNQSIYGGINLKSSDIVGLEKSYAQFLMSIYQEQIID